tara:strand:+ start:831 stop:1130 length:300 start_codon:yes stop_codon:yes gene_type:complete
MNTTQKITNAMNVKSEVQTENIFTPAPKLIDSAIELNEKIEQLKESIDHQKDTLVNWRVEDNALQSATEYRNEMIEDVIKLEQLKRSFCLVCDEMIRKI